MSNFQKTKVILNGQYSSWSNVESGVHQGSILGPLIYIKNLSDNISSPKLYLDDAY